MSKGIAERSRPCRIVRLAWSRGGPRPASPQHKLEQQTLSAIRPPIRHSFCESQKGIGEYPKHPDLPTQPANRSTMLDAHVCGRARQSRDDTIQPGAPQAPKFGRERLLRIKISPTSVELLHRTPRARETANTGCTNSWIANFLKSSTDGTYGCLQGSGVQLEQFPRPSRSIG